MIVLWILGSTSARNMVIGYRISDKYNKRIIIEKIINRSNKSETVQELGKITEWVLRGEPTTEDEFKSMFRKVTGADVNGTAIETDDTSKWGVTWKQVSDKMTAIDATHL